MKQFILGLVLFFLVIPGHAIAATYPQYVGYVNDFAGVLSPGFVSQLNAKLTDFNHKTTNQIAVVTVATTQPEPIEEYSIHLSDQWKVGQAGKDNGIIMLFAMQDHTMRIEVGRGLEGDVTDVATKHIQDNLIVPAFKKGKYELGISNGVDAVIGTIMHDPHYATTLSSVSPNQTANTNSNTPSTGSVVLFFVIIFCIFLLSLFTPLRGIVLWLLFSMLTNGRWGGGDDGPGSGGGNDKFGGGGFSGGGSSDKW